MGFNSKTFVQNIFHLLSISIYRVYTKLKIIMLLKELLIAKMLHLGKVCDYSIVSSNNNISTCLFV